MLNSFIKKNDFPNIYSTNYRVSSPITPKRQSYVSPISYDDLSIENTLNYIKNSNIYDDSTLVYDILSKSDKGISKLIVDCSICSAYHLENSLILDNRIEDLFYGIKLLSKVFGIIDIVFVISDNLLKFKHAIEVFIKTSNIALKIIKSKYPQNNKQLLYTSITGKKGKYSSNKSCTILNAGSICQIYDLFVNCIKKPLKFITIKSNDECGIVLQIARNTTYKDLLNHLEINISSDEYLYSGEPIKANLVDNYEDVIPPCVTSLFIHKKENNNKASSSCINCGKCHEICPVSIVPNVVISNNTLQTNNHDLSECICCNLCSYICPCNIDVFGLLDKARSKKNE